MLASLVEEPLSGPVCDLPTFQGKVLVPACRMDQCLIFCRTNFDCDNLEAFLKGVGGGGGFQGKMERGKENPYSCLVLAGQRSMQERRAALQVPLVLLRHLQMALVLDSRLVECPAVSFGLRAPLMEKLHNGQLAPI